MRYLLLLVMLTGCTTTEQGKSLDHSNYADIGSTALALAVDAGAEVNPLGVALVPLKVGMGWGMEKYTKSCYRRQEFTKWGNTFYYGAAANNIAVIAGATVVSPLIGVAAGVGYYFMRETLEPDVFSCTPDVPALQSMVSAYKVADITLLEGVFTENAIESNMLGETAILEAYASMFSDGKERNLWFLNEEYLSVEMDGKWWHYSYTIAYDGDKISRFDYKDVTVEEVRAL